METVIWKLNSVSLTSLKCVQQGKTLASLSGSLHFPYKCRAAAPCITLYPLHPNAEMLKVNF